MINWRYLLNDNTRGVLTDFANNRISERALTHYFAFTPFAGEFRKLVRKHGVQQARALCRRALGRRQQVSR